jgi:hypothetical protein
LIWANTIALVKFPVVINNIVWSGMKLASKFFYQFDSCYHIEQLNLFTDHFFNIDLFSFFNIPNTTNPR